MKPGRQGIIMDIINTRNIETQWQLLEALTERGVTTTQATLSRDIKDMRLVKELTSDGRYRYSAPNRAETDDSLERLQKIFKECVISCDLAQNLIVMHTLPGLASAACSALDSMDIPGLVGSIAGDDTAFLAMKDIAVASKLINEIESLFQ